MQHTPAPWHLTSEPDARIQSIAGTNGGPTLVAKCETHLANTHAENMANARLIAKSPELWKASVAVVASSHKLQDGQHDTPEGFLLVNEQYLLWLSQLLNELARASERV